MAFAVSFIPAGFMGVLFPLGLRIYAGDIHRIGGKAGNIFLQPCGRQMVIHSTML